MAGKKRISVVIPTRNEAKYIEACIRSVAANRGEGFEVQILIVDGLSEDGTRNIVEALAGEGLPVSVLSNPKRYTPSALNIAINATEGDFILFLGAHATIPDDYIQKCLNAAEVRKDAWCVGGSIKTISDSPLGTAIADAMSSPFGVGNARFRTGGYTGEVDTLTFGLYHRWVFNRIGGFDEELVRNQDDDLNLRIVEAGGILYMDEGIASTYFSRSSLSKLFRQYYQYGYWRLITMRKHRKVASLRQLVPTLFVLFVVAGGVAAALSRTLALAYLACLSVYVAFLLSGAIGIARKKGMRSGLIAPLVFVILHSAYGLGFWGAVATHIMSRGDHSAATGLSR